MNMFPNFEMAIQSVEHKLLHVSYPVDGKRWQSTDVSHKPEMVMREVFNTSFAVGLLWEDYRDYRDDIKPNLPWADDHFEERIGGQPLNPGNEWRNWPWGLSADKHRTEGEQFSHTYMERYWPKHANAPDLEPRRGIRYEYGDLSDCVEHLFQHPETRQAYLPVWFPEDTGVAHGKRVPCTLGYHLLYRMGYLHMTYYIRSCDFVRHFRDDLYLSLRLQLWILDQLRGQSEAWEDARPGTFVFHCVSMHCFENDHRTLVNEAKA
ncbi:hypothetical protein [[Eubacterium] cellulosolvens]